MTTKQFTPALALNRAFYKEIVGPALAGIPHAAARVGWGSEILGFDTPQSTDHGWGPHLQVFVEALNAEHATHVVEAVLPESFGGWPVRYGWDAKNPRHHVYVNTLDAWLVDRLGLDPTQGLAPTDWLRIPQQRLLAVTAGAVYNDDLGELTAARALLAWYPDEVWLWIVACQWRRIGQEEAFVGRAAEVGDEIGSRVVAARLARELMRLWFLLARVYWPYTKWFGSAFSRLPDSDTLRDLLNAALAAEDYAARETALVSAYEVVATRHNDLGITPFVEPVAQTFYGRPYRVLLADRFVAACIDRLDSPALRSAPLIGAIDQFVDSTDVLDYPRVFTTVAAAYDSLINHA